MAAPVPPLHCVPDRKLSQPELERSNACLGAVVVERDRTIVGLQDYARDVSKVRKVGASDAHTASAPGS